MAGCNDGRQTLDPYQSIINGINKSVNTLENQADIIKPIVDEFDAAAALIPPSNSTVVSNALNQLTAEAICASSTDLQPINDFTADCLNEATAAVKRYLKNILSNIEEGLQLIGDILSLPEYALFSYYQRIWALADSIKDLITGLNNKIQCITSAPNAAIYSSQIQDINDKIDAVIDDLRLSDDGSFDADIFLAGLGASLKANVKSYADKSATLQQDIQDNISNTVDLTATVNPTTYF